MLPWSTEEFSRDLPPAELFPDAVVGPVLAKAGAVTPRTFAAQSARGEIETLGQPIAEPEFTLAQSRELVQAALDKFDPALGERARAFFNAGFDEAARKADAGGTINWDAEPATRWRLQHGEGPGMMRCLPAGMAASEYSPANPGAHAVVDLQFDGTIGSMITLGHELGHALADEQLREAGYTDRDNPAHMAELQAYYVQHIVYDGLMAHEDPAIREAARQHYAGTMAENLYDIPVAQAAQAAQEIFQAGGYNTVSMLQASRAYDAILRAELGDNWRDYENAGKGMKALENTISGDDQVAGNARKYLANEAGRIHGRPMSILLARGLYEGARKQEGSRNWVGRTVLGGNGPENINQVLASTGIERREQMQEFADGVVGNTAEYLRQPRHDETLEARTLQAKTQLAAPGG